MKDSKQNSFTSQRLERRRLALMFTYWQCWLKVQSSPWLVASPCVILLGGTSMEASGRLSVERKVAKCLVI